jgi:alanine-glyoxylate transaminase / serine-glyoxylate transaminase / serine-pyruvate transaminase
MTRVAGRQLVQPPGPTNVPDRVLRALATPTVDHRGPIAQQLVKDCLAGFDKVFGFGGDPVIMYAASGTGSWMAALSNTLNPGDKVVGFETGHFGRLWADMVTDLGFELHQEPTDWRSPIDVNKLESILKADKEHKIKAVCAVHNETSTGVTSDIAGVRKAMDAAKHPALLFVDTISGLGSIPYEHKAWGVDVTIGGSQKGLMLPPGLSFNVASAKALEANKTAKYPKGYWKWAPIIAQNKDGMFPYTPATNMLFALREALSMLQEEGMQAVFARHARLAEATRRAVRGWGLENVCKDPKYASNTVTSIYTPEGVNADQVRNVIYDKFNIALGSGLGQLAGKNFRIGHLGDFNETMLTGVLAGVEIGMDLAGMKIQKGGVSAALSYFAEN